MLVIKKLFDLFPYLSIQLDELKKRLKPTESN